MAQRISLKKAKELAFVYDMTVERVREIETWMEENVGEYENTTQLAEEAEYEVGKEGEDDEIFFEVAAAFESVI